METVAFSLQCSILTFCISGECQIRQWWRRFCVATQVRSRRQLEIRTRRAACSAAVRQLHGGVRSGSWSDLSFWRRYWRHHCALRRLSVTWLVLIRLSCCFVLIPVTGLGLYSCRGRIVIMDRNWNSSNLSAVTVDSTKQIYRRKGVGNVRWRTDSVWIATVWAGTA